MKKSISLLLCGLAFAAQSQTAPAGGRTCGTSILPQQFETWLNSLPQQVQGGPKMGGGNTQSIYNIPVIVHIIHNNENVNSASATSGGNLNAAQVIDQINILNKDYQGLNQDSTLIPAVFKPLFTKMQVNFCLAVVNPTGGILAEPGIDRINRTTKGWTAPPYSQTYIDATVKPNSIWDPNRYLNIWVCGLSNSLLGYATFPNPGASGVTGLSGFGTLSTDGVVILNTSFGSIGTAQFGAYNRGRTATHEIGHWMGLRHIWGDGTCATDYCNDTPPAQTANYNCPAFPYKLGTCSGNSTGEMTMNYMDYTNDACMYMFTHDQKVRAQLILSYSPMRSALITSTACNLPSVGMDPGISSISSPNYTQTINCNNFINPVLNITNYGSVVVNSLLVTYNVDGVNTQTINWVGTANPGTTFPLTIPQISNLSNGPHTFSANISNPNGGADVNLANNSNIQNFVVANVMTVTVNSPTTCSGAAVTLSATGGASYNWTNVGSGASVTVAPQSTTVYSVTISNSVCNIVRISTVTVIPGPSLTVNNPSVCAGIQTTLTVAGANTYTWNTGSNNTSVLVTNSVNTQYTVSGSVPNGCSSSIIATVSILPSPTLAVNNVSTCAGVSATLSASGAGSYTWSTGSNNNSILVTPNTTTTYTVSGSVSGCVSNKTVTVTVGSQLSIFITPAAPQICVGGSVNLTASGAASYSWNNGPATALNAVSPTVTTTYTVGGINGTCPGFQVVTVTVNTLPALNLTASNVKCFGGATGSISASANGNGPFSYTYSSGPAGLTAGNYSVLVSDNNGCVNSASVAISQPTQLQSQSTAGITRCPNSCDGTLQITATGGVGPYTATLYPVFIPGLTYSTLCAGSYTYYVTDNNGCTQFSAVQVAAGNSSIAITTTVTNVSCAVCSNASVSATGTGGTAPYTYIWTPGNNLGQYLFDVGEGCYTVTVKDAEGCNSQSVACVVFDVGVKELSNVLQLSAAPNPVSGKLSISGMPAGKKVLTVTDTHGRVIVHIETDSADYQLSCASFADGVYILTVSTSEKSGHLKFVKE